MSATDLRTNLHILIDKMEDESVLQAHLTLLSRQFQEQTDFWDKLDTPTKQAINKGIRQAEMGMKTDFFQFMEDEYDIAR